MAATTLSVLETFGVVTPTTLTAPLPVTIVRDDGSGVAHGVVVEESMTNLVTNPSVEANLTGYSPNGAGTDFTRDLTIAWVGGASILLAPTAAAQRGVSFVSVAVTVGQSYAFSTRLRRKAGQSTITVSIDWYNGATFLSQSAVTFNLSQAPVGQWVQATAVGTAPASTTAAYGTVTYMAPVVGDQVNIDALQIEQKAYATSYCDGSLGTGYAWTGTPHASTSTRAGAVLFTDNAISLSGPMTICAWFRPNVLTGGGRRVLTIGAGSSGADRFGILIDPTGVYGSRSGNSTGATTPVAAALAAGDLVFVALTWDGATLTCSASKNGGGLASTSVASAAAYSAPLTRVAVGSATDAPTVTQLLGAIEQALVYSAALSAADLAAMAVSTALYDYDIPTPSGALPVFAAATAKSGSTSAISAAGVGSYRTKRSVTATNFTSTTTGPTSSTHVATFTSSSGLGVGDVIRGTDFPYTLQLNSVRVSYKVIQVSSAGGAETVYFQQQYV